MLRLHSSLNYAAYFRTEITSTCITTTIYPNKYYNTDGSKETKHIYAGGSLAATIDTDGAHFIHTDHLTGSNVVTDENGDVEQAIDYYPYGELRLNEKASFFDEKHF